MNYRIPKLNKAYFVCKKIVENLCLNVVQRKLALIDLKYETIPKSHALLNDNLITNRKRA